VRPAGGDKEVGSSTILLFDEAQQKKFGIDEEGKVVDQKLFDKVMKSLEEEAEKHKSWLTSKQEKTKKKKKKNKEEQKKGATTTTKPHQSQKSHGKPKLGATKKDDDDDNSTSNVTEAAEEDIRCSYDGEDCRETKCCDTPGLQCYVKNDDWAMCKDQCIPGFPDPADNGDSGAWNCTALGDRAKGSPKECSDSGADCRKTGCCSTAGETCFEKNQSFAACRVDCQAGVADMGDEDWHPWTCKALGPKKSGAAWWLQDTCTTGDDDCSQTKCCTEAFKRCYEKEDGGWAQCKWDCSTEVDPEREWEGAWSCKELGYQTPAYEKQPGQGPPSGKVAPWVKERCVEGYDDCVSAGCCKQPGTQCFKLKEFYGQCADSCPFNENSTDADEDHLCQTVGMKSYGFAFQGWPALYCYAVLRVTGYEPTLMKKQYEAGAGIFACDGYDMVANGVITIGDKETLKIPSVEVGTSQDGTAANTLLFMKVWDVVIEKGDYVYYDWITKVDPDAVLMPDRLRLHVAPHTNTGDHEDRLFFVNCNAWPEAPTFPMMYGALEVFSRKAIMAYAEHNFERCQSLDWELWGEDFYMTRCMDQIDVGRIADFRIIGDNTCVGPGQSGANCNDADVAAFHPFKEVEDWIGCFQTATGITLSVDEGSGDEGGDGDSQAESE
jgi:hypothetical protein